jgi:short-subunit dehydrogenase
MPRLAMVTGASSGIGEAYAERLASDGWDLVLVARRRDRLEQLTGRLTTSYGVSARAAVADLGEQHQLAALCAEAAELPLDLLVNNAGLAHYGPFIDLDLDAAAELVGVNVLAPLMLTRSALPGMVSRGAGSVVNVASLLAFSGAWQASHAPQRAVYAGTKSFIVTFTRIVADELAGTGVRLQVLCPGIVRTEFHTRQGMDLSAVPRMEPADVVQASLVDLDRGVIVSIPGAAGDDAIAPVDEAQQVLAGITRTVELPERYR